MDENQPSGAWSGSSASRAECEGLFFGRNGVSEKKTVGTFNAAEQDNPTTCPTFKKTSKAVFFCLFVRCCMTCKL